jgi:hypothetical protein
LLLGRTAAAAVGSSDSCSSLASCFGERRRVRGDFHKKDRLWSPCTRGLINKMHRLTRYTPLKKRHRPHSVRYTTSNASVSIPGATVNSANSNLPQTKTAPSFPSPKASPVPLDHSASRGTSTCGSGVPCEKLTESEERVWERGGKDKLRMSSQLEQPLDERRRRPR